MKWERRKIKIQIQKRMKRKKKEWKEKNLTLCPLIEVPSLKKIFNRCYSFRAVLGFQESSAESVEKPHIPPLPLFPLLLTSHTNVACLLTITGGLSFLGGWVPGSLCALTWGVGGCGYTLHRTDDRASRILLNCPTDEGASGVLLNCPETSLF